MMKVANGFFWHNCEFHHSKIEKEVHFPQKIYKLSKTNWDKLSIFFSHFEGTRGEKKANISHPSGQGETEDLVKFFKETNGEIYITEATCRTYTMEIDSYVPIAFNDGFTSALRSLEFAASQPKDSKLANRLFRSDD